MHKGYRAYQPYSSAHVLLEKENAPLAHVLMHWVIEGFSDELLWIYVST
jgi:hypothetical protein